MSGRRRYRDQSLPEQPGQPPNSRFNRRRYDDLSNRNGRILRGLQSLIEQQPYHQLDPFEVYSPIGEAVQWVHWPPMPTNPQPPPSDQVPAVPAVPAALQGLANDWRSVLENKDLADFTIKCGSSTIKVHSLVLAVRSPVFKAMLQHDTVENRNREVIIDDMESDTLEVMLEYIYCSKVKLDDLEFRKVCQLAAAADRYGLIELKDACFQHLFKDINLQNAGDLMILARRYSGPREYLKKALDFCTKNFKDLRKDPEFKDVMKECLDDFFDPENN